MLEIDVKYSLLNNHLTQFFFKVMDTKKFLIFRNGLVTKDTLLLHENYKGLLLFPGDFHYGCMMSTHTLDSLYNFLRDFDVDEETRINISVIMRGISYSIRIHGTYDAEQEFNLLGLKKFGKHEFNEFKLKRIKYEQYK